MPKTHLEVRLPFVFWKKKKTKQNCLYLGWLLSFMEKEGSVKLVQEPRIHRWWEIILNTEHTGAKGQLPVLLLQGEFRGLCKRAREPKRTLGKCFPKPKGLGFRLRQPLSCLAGKGEPPEIRPVVIWKIIANFFHPLSSILCAWYLLFYKILVHFNMWRLLLLLLIINKISFYR